jgi:hypothetical protein
MKADLKPAVAFTSVDFVLAFDPHLAFQPALPLWMIAPVRRWQALQWQTYTLPGSPDVIARSRPQWHSAILSIRFSPNLLLRDFAILAPATAGVERLIGKSEPAGWVRFAAGRRLRSRSRAQRQPLAIVTQFADERDRGRGTGMITSWLSVRSRSTVAHVSSSSPMSSRDQTSLF